MTTVTRRYQLAGTGELIRLALCRDRIGLSAGLYLIVAATAGTAYEFGKLYPTPAGRAALAATGQANPALRFLYGRLDGSSLGALTTWRYGVWAAIFPALLSIFTVVRHTRSDEEAGRLELIGSAAVGRHAPLVAALLTAGSANLIVAGLLAAALPLVGLPTAGLAALALGIGCCGLAFAGIAAVAARLTTGAYRAASRSPCSASPSYCVARATRPGPGSRGPRRSAGSSSPARSPPNAGGYSPCRWPPSRWESPRPSPSPPGGTSAPACCRPAPAPRAPPARCAARSAWPGGCSAARCSAGPPVTRSSSPPPARRPRASASCSAPAARSSASSPGSVAKLRSPTPTWPR